MGKEEKMTYSFHVSINGREAIDMSQMTEAERKEIYQKLCKQYIENGLRGKIITA